MLEKKVENTKKDLKIEILKTKESFPCNRPSHKKGKIPTQAQLAYRRIREGD